MTVSPITTATPVVAKRPDALGTEDFLRLMTEQLKAQDPFAPQDNAQMVAQMAQMSASSGIAEINTTLTRISAQLADHGAALAALAKEA
jgi:flagellar basal-body rod modification protein FlgD